MSEQLITPINQASGLTRAKRADAQRNRDNVVLAAREAFAERGASTSLEEIARRAGVGIGTLYRNFPNRPSLLEAVYLDEVQDVSDSAAEFARLEPWEALSGWLHRVVSYFVTKQALAHEMLDYMERDAPLFQTCRGQLYEAGEPLLRRAQEAHAVRGDISLAEIIPMVGGIAKSVTTDPAQVDRILDIALDGLRYTPDAD
jgi:AcrR family transcriptional regulator